MTKITGLSKSVKFINGDFIDVKYKGTKFTHAISFLTLLHIQNKEKALSNIFSSLKKNGLLYIDDYYLLKSIDYSTQYKILHTISCPRLYLLKDFTKAILDCGFDIIEINDMTSNWKKLASDRYWKLRDEYIKYSNIFGKNIVESYSSFCEGVSDLYTNKIIGGINIIARKNS